MKLSTHFGQIVEWHSPFVLVSPLRNHGSAAAPSSIHDYSILFLVIMKGEEPNVFKLVKTKSA